MKFGPIPVGQAVGKILAHNIARADGHKAFRKGKVLTVEDVRTLRKAGCETIYVAELEAGDIDENSAARQIGEAAALFPGTRGGLQINGHSQGRVNLTALTAGVLRVDAARLDRINECEGVTFATLRSLSIVEVGQSVATVKIIPYALPAAVLERAMRIADEVSKPLVAVRGFQRKQVAVIYSGSVAARERLVKSFDPPLRKRIESFDARVVAEAYVHLAGKSDEAALAEVLHQQVSQGMELIVLAGETSTMDHNDIIPRAVICAGGEVACVGAPIEPGNLVTLAYLDDTPVLGVPGCIRSPKPTLVNHILAALLAGEHLVRADITRLGYGGLLEDTRHGT
jgi:molybdenum cofactor cytidylyltransferase